MNDGKFYDRLVTDNAPVTGAIIIASALFTVFFGIQGRSDKLGLSFQVNQCLPIRDCCLFC